MMRRPVIRVGEIKKLRHRLIIVLSAGSILACVPVLAANAINAEIKTFQYAPGMLKISVGDTVAWTNHDAIEHSVTVKTGPENLDTGLFGRDETASLTFSKAGDYEIFCTRHNSMMAKVVVE